MLPAAFCGLRPLFAITVWMKSALPLFVPSRKAFSLSSAAACVGMAKAAARVATATSRDLCKAGMLIRHLDWELVPDGLRHSCRAGTITSRLPLLPMGETRPERSICSMSRAARL